MLSKEEKEQVAVFVQKISQTLLDIKAPLLVFSTDVNLDNPKKVSSTITEEGCLLYINPEIEYTPEILKCIGYELRHIYQYYQLNIENEIDVYMGLSNIKNEELTNKANEIDAFAFGSICMKYYGYKPQWDKFDDIYIAKINKREKEILSHEFTVY